MRNAIVGTITGATGAAIPLASIRVTNVGTGIERLTETDSSSSAYVVTNLSLGSYRLVAEAKGFQRFVNPAE